MFDISIKAKLYSLLLIVIGILLIFSTLIYRVINPIQQEWQFYQDNVAKRQSLLMSIKSEFGYGGTIHNFKNYILRATPKYYDRLDGNFSRLDKAINLYLALPDITGDEKNALQDIKAVFSNYKEQAEKAKSLIQQGNGPEKVDSIVKVNDSPAFKAFIILDKSYKQLTQLASSKLSKKIESTLSMAVYGSIFLILLISIIIILITRLVTHRLDDFEQTLQDIVDTNNISFRLSDDKQDEISHITRLFNQLLNNFTQLIKGIIGASIAVGSESSSQASIVEKTVQGIRLQHKKINLVTHSMQQMSETVKNVSDNAEQAVSAAELASQGITTGSQHMSQMIQSMTRLNQHIDSASQTISLLEQDSQQISTVLEVIHNISEQTNLLALNAAIEAARAGEQGRGFAVVADEVRALAARTKDSTDEINSMIERLQNQVQSAVKAMNDSLESTRQSSNLASEAGSILDKVSSDIQNMSAAMTQIGLTSSEQSQVSTEMVQHIDVISESAENTHKLSDDILKATGLIGKKTESLNEEAGKFKIDDSTFQLEQAKASHLAWRSNLISFLHGETDLNSSQIGTHKDCSLGKWFYADGLQKFAHLPEMKELEIPHIEIHQVIHNIVDLKNSAKDAEAKQELEKIEPLSNQIVSILDRIINKI